MRLTLLVLLIGFSHPKQINAGANAPTLSELPKVELCELLKNPLLYDQKVVRITAIYRHGGEELSVLYCGECLEGGRIYADFDESYYSLTKKKISKLLVKEGTVRLVMSGTFYSSGGAYGHLNQYRFMFRISKIEKARILRNTTSNPGNLPKTALRRLRCG